MKYTLKIASLVLLAIFLGAGCTKSNNESQANNQVVVQANFDSTDSDFERKINCQKFLEQVKITSKELPKEQGQIELNPTVCFSKRLDTCVSIIGVYTPKEATTFWTVDDVLTNRGIFTALIPKREKPGIKNQEELTYEENKKDLDCL